MSKTLLYILLFAILGGGVYFFVFQDAKNPFGASEASFQIQDTGRIGEIFLAKTDGEEVRLIRTDSGWVLNNEYKARSGNVTNLLSTLSRQKAQYPVPTNMHNSVIKALAGTGIKVELYDRKGKKINTFYVGNEAFGYQGSFMLQEGAKTAYVVQMPGFHGYLTPYYAADAEEWRDRSVINLQPQEVQYFSIRYDEEPQSSFTIQRSGEEWKVTADSSIPKPLNENRVHAYLKFMKDNYCEGYLNGIPHLDSIIASVPRFCEMEVIANDGRKQKVQIFKMPLNKRSKNLTSPDGGNFDIDRFYGVINNARDTVLLQAYTFDKFFRSGWEFFEADPPPAVPGVPRRL